MSTYLRHSSMVEKRVKLFFGFIISCKRSVASFSLIMFVAAVDVVDVDANGSSARSLIDKRSIALIGFILEITGNIKKRTCFSYFKVTQDLKRPHLYK